MYSSNTIVLRHYAKMLLKNLAGVKALTVRNVVTPSILFSIATIVRYGNFLAVFLITQSKTNISALSLKRYLGVSYPTAWLVKHKLMQTMAEREDQRQLKGRVTTDDAYLDSVTSVGKRGRGAKRLGLCMAAVEADVDSSVRYVHFDLLPDLSAHSIKCWAGKTLQSN
jgi:hypothetical protein